MRNRITPRHRPHGRWKIRRPTDARRLAAMGAPDLPWPPWSVGEVLMTGRLPGNLTGAMSDRLRFTREDRGPLSSEWCDGRGLYAFLGHLSSRVDSVPGLERLSLMGVERDGTVNLLHFSPPSRSSRITLTGISSASPGSSLPHRPPPLVADIPGEAFTVQRAVTRANHMVNVEGRWTDH